MSTLAEFFEDNIHNVNMFLQRAGWFSARRIKIDDDGSARCYFRLEKESGETAILMEAVPDGHELSTIGHKTKDFDRIARFLAKHDCRVPEIYQADHEHGLLLLEDFGDTSFKALIEQSGNEDDLYGLATDCLAGFKKLPISGLPPLPAFFGSHVHEGRRRLADWYAPAVLGRVNPNGFVKHFIKIWDDIEASVPAPQMGFMHIDFHVENLMWLEQGSNHCGVIDFQGAMYGPLAYDLGNILEDPRNEISRDLRLQMLERYCHDMNVQDKELFMLWYRILATQFHCRVLGQFIKLAIVAGKTQYLQYLPRLCRYITDHLSDPVLRPLKNWCEIHGLDFDPDNLPQNAVEIDEIKAYIRGDAF